MRGIHSAEERQEEFLSLHLAFFFFVDLFAPLGANLDAGSLDEASLRGKEEKWILQRRVFVPLLPPVMLSDYLSAEETLQVSIEAY